MNYICFDIGGTKIKYGLLDDNYNILEKNDVDTNAKQGGESVIAKVIDIINDYKLKHKLKGVAISTAGVVDHINGSIIYANDIMPGYTGLKIVDLINEKTNLPASVENDVNCFALSHILYNNDDYLMVAIGTGIGGSIVINKKIYHGISNSAGEFGTMLINGTKYENLASVSSLVRTAKKIGLDVNSGLEVFKLFDEGNSYAISAVNYFYKNLAIGLVNIGQIFNFSKIILGGGITNRKTFLDELMLEIDKYKDPAYFKTKVEISPNTNDGGMIGALVNFKSKYA